MRDHVLDLQRHLIELPGLNLIVDELIADDAAVRGGMSAIWVIDRALRNWAARGVSAQILPSHRSEEIATPISQGGNRDQQVVDLLRLPVLFPIEEEKSLVVTVIH